MEWFRGFFVTLICVGSLHPPQDKLTPLSTEPEPTKDHQF
jgi:hypothetical protein